MVYRTREKQSESPDLQQQVSLHVTREKWYRHAKAISTRKIEDIQLSVSMEVPSASDHASRKPHIQLECFSTLMNLPTFTVDDMFDVPRIS